MSKNFDEEVRAERAVRDRTFVIGGETFAYRADFTPEEFSELTDEYATRVVPGTPELPRGEAVRIVDETIKGFLVTDEDRERWEALRARPGGTAEVAEELAVIAFDMQQVVLFLIQEQTGRPTEAPSPSGNGLGRTGQRSTAPSSSVVVASGDSRS